MWGGILSRLSCRANLGADYFKAAYGARPAYGGNAVAFGQPEQTYGVAVGQAEQAYKNVWDQETHA
jgi:hypothetical protein